MKEPNGFFAVAEELPLLTLEAAHLRLKTPL